MNEVDENSSEVRLDLICILKPLPKGEAAIPYEMYMTSLIRKALLI